MEVDTSLLEFDWDPIAELESILSDSFKLSPNSTQSATVSEAEVQGPNVTAILAKLETLLETSLEIISSDDEVKQEFHHVLEQLGKFEDHVPFRLRPVIDQLQTLLEDIDGKFVTAQKTIQDYDQLLLSKSNLSKQLESAKAQKDEINSKVSQGKAQLEKINLEILEVEKKLSGLVETRDNLQRGLNNCTVEKNSLMSEVAQWVPECRNVISALEKSESSYNVALTAKKKAEDEWAELKLAFVENNKI